MVEGRGHGLTEARCTCAGKGGDDGWSLYVGCAIATLCFPLHFQEAPGSALAFWDIP